MKLGTGYKPDSYDAADIPFSSSAAPKPNVNLSETQPTWLQEIYDQGDSSSCVANATAASFRFLANMMNGTASANLFTTDPSRLFIYYNARDMEQQGEVTDNGSINRLAMKSLKQFGVCSNTADPFIITEDGFNRPVENINTPPKPEAYAEAKAVHVLKYCRLDPDYPDEEEPNATEDERNTAGATTLHNLKQCLTEGYPVVLGFKYYWDDPPWETDTGSYSLLPSLDANQRHKPPPTDANGNSFGGHAVLAIGYDDSTGQILCQNSWGKGWSKAGLFHMTYDWITDWEATNDFWTLRLIQRDG